MNETNSENKNFYPFQAAYASHVESSRGRIIFEPEMIGRPAFQRDRERIIHSRAFRRLKHKTQVFISAESDHYRTRLTHTLEVSQIARALARLLHLNEDLTETIALAHDLGHPPFGHVGEDSLNFMMENYGGFDHNAQTLHIVTKLEDRYLNFKGLNLTWESLEGIVKHNGPLIGSFSKHRALPHFIANFDKDYPLDLEKFSSLEAQCAAIADDIAYNAHDIDDGLRSGVLTLELLEEPTISREILDDIKKNYPKLTPSYYAYELARRQISLMIQDVIKTAKFELQKLQPKSVLDIYNAQQMVVKFSPKMQRKEKELKKFLYKNFYQHEKLLPQRENAEKIIKTLFESYMHDIKLLPSDLRKNLDSQSNIQYDNLRAQIICDFLSGMTDNYAKQEYKKIIS